MDRKEREEKINAVMRDLEVTRRQAEFIVDKESDVIELDSDEADNDTGA